MKTRRTVFICFLLIICMLIGFFVVWNNKKTIQKISNSEINSSTNSLTISFWAKPVDNSYNNLICKISDGNESLFLYNNTQDENWNSRGITLAHEYGYLFGNERNELFTGENSLITIEIKNRTISLYLDAELVNTTKLPTKFNVKNALIEFDNCFEVNNAKYYNYNLESYEIKKEFKENIEYKTDNLVFQESNIWVD